MPAPGRSGTSIGRGSCVRRYRLRMRQLGEDHHSICSDHRFGGERIRPRYAGERDGEAPIATGGSSRSSTNSFGSARTFVDIESVERQQDDEQNEEYPRLRVLNQNTAISIHDSAGITGIDNDDGLQIWAHRGNTPSRDRSAPGNHRITTETAGRNVTATW